MAEMSNTKWHKINTFTKFETKNIKSCLYFLKQIYKKKKNKWTEQANSGINFTNVEKHFEFTE